MQYPPMQQQSFGTGYSPYQQQSMVQQQYPTNTSFMPNGGGFPPMMQQQYPPMTTSFMPNGGGFGGSGGSMDISSMFAVDPTALSMIDQGFQMSQGLMQQKIGLVMQIAQNPALAEAYGPVLDQIEQAQAGLEPVLNLQKDIMDYQSKLVKVQTDAIKTSTDNVSNAAKSVQEMGASISSLSDGIKPRGSKGGGGGGGMPGG
jgi:hypothetical protein